MNILHLAPALLLALAACSTTPLPPKAGDASLAGKIGSGDGSQPMLRVCALAVSAGTGRCIEVPAAASSYRIDRLGAGRYYVMGWAKEGDVRVFAHAASVTCVTAPCNDNLTAVEVADGDTRDGVDLTGTYAKAPAGWPTEPAAD